MGFVIYIIFTEFRKRVKPIYKMRRSEKQAIRRRLKLLELEDAKYFSDIRKMEIDKTTEIRNWTNGVMLSFENLLVLRTEKKINVDSNNIFRCPDTKDPCLLSGKIVYATMLSYREIIGKIIKNTKDYIWATTLQNGFFELSKIDLQRYINENGQMFWDRITDEIKTQIPHELAYKYDENKFTVEESRDLFKKYINGVISIKKRYEFKNNTLTNNHNKVIQKIYEDDDIDDNGK